MAKRASRVVKAWALYTGDTMAVDGKGRPFIAFRKEDVYHGMRIPLDNERQIEIRPVQPRRKGKVRR